MRKGSAIGYTVFLILVGAVLGTIVGQIAGNYGVKYLGNAVAALGINPPAVLDLKVLVLTIGFTLKMNLAGVAGAIIGLVVARRG